MAKEYLQDEPSIEWDHNLIMASCLRPEVEDFKFNADTCHHFSNSGVVASCFLCFWKKFKQLAMI